VRGALGRERPLEGGGVVMDREPDRRLALQGAEHDLRRGPPVSEHAAVRPTARVCGTIGSLEAGGLAEPRRSGDRPQRSARRAQGAHRVGLIDAQPRRHSERPLDDRRLHAGVGRVREISEPPYLTSAAVSGWCRPVRESNTKPQVSYRI